MRPLDGIRIVDFSRVLAGPMATQIMSDLGAEVIKVERPGFGDEARTFEPFFANGQSAYFSAFNRSKKSIAIDLRQAAGQELATELAATADVMVENFLPGGMDKLGLGYEAVSARNPSVVYISSTGFGHTGPYSRRKGYDTIFQALSGIVELTGHPDGPPAKVGVPFADITSGLWIVIAALTGLQGRHSTGRGCHVDLAMMDVQVSLLGLPAAWWFAEGRKPERTGTGHMGRVPSAAFQCACGRWLFISGSDQHWPALCRVLQLDMPNWSLTNSARVERCAEITDMLASRIRAWDRDRLAEALRAAEVPAGEVNTVPEILQDPHTVERGMVASFQDGGGGATPALATPGRFSGYDSPVLSPPPLLGEQTDEILQDLNLDRDRISQLRQAGVVS